jgi:hypothetical protein
LGLDASDGVVPLELEQRTPADKHGQSIQDNVSVAPGNLLAMAMALDPRYFKRVDQSVVDKIKRWVHDQYSQEARPESAPSSVARKSDILARDTLAARNVEQMSDLVNRGF